MSLIRFLSAGSRGLAQGAPPMGRYRLPSGRVLPNFGQGRNPFSKDLPPQKDPPPEADVAAKAALTQAAPPSPVVPGKPLPAAELKPVVRRGIAKRVAWRAAALVKGVFGGVLGWRPWRRVRPLKSGTVSAVRGPVQGELSLEKVRVVRNDLNESDYEVVCTDTSTASPVTLKRVPRSTDEPGRPMGRLAERLFGAKPSD